MASSLDMTLDERIKSSRTNTQRSRTNTQRGRGWGRTRRGRGPGGPVSGGRMSAAASRAPVVGKARPSSHAIGKSIRRTRTFPWQHDLFEDSIRAAGILGIEVGTKLYVSNLEQGVTNDDIRELFSEIGYMKRYAIHYDRNGCPSGSAEVVYTRRSDAFAALKRYNNVLLDGKPMKIEVVGAKAELPVTARVNVTGFNGQPKRTVVMTPGGGRTSGSAETNGSAAIRRRHGGARGGGGGRGRGHGRATAKGAGCGRGKKGVNSAEELDKELDTYHAEAMNIS